MFSRLKHILLISFASCFVFAGFIAQPTYAQSSTIEKNTEQLRKLSLFPDETPLGLTDFRVYVSNFYLFSIGASILIAVMLMMIGGVIWLTSAGNQSRVSKAQEYIINAIIGVVLLLGSYTIIQAINPRLVQLDDPNLPKIPAFGSCLYPKTYSEAPSKPSIKNPTHFCYLQQKAECKNPGVFDERKGCEDFCNKYSSDDGSCINSDELKKQEKAAKKAREAFNAAQSRTVNRNLQLTGDPTNDAKVYRIDLLDRGQIINPDGSIQPGVADIAPQLSREEFARIQAQQRR